MLLPFSKRRMPSEQDWEPIHSLNGHIFTVSSSNGQKGCSVVILQPLSGFPERRDMQGHTAIYCGGTWPSHGYILGFWTSSPFLGPLASMYYRQGPSMRDFSMFLSHGLSHICHNPENKHTSAHRHICVHVYTCAHVCVHATHTHTYLLSVHI